MAQRRNKRKWLIWGAILLILIIGVVTAIVLNNGSRSDDSTETVIEDEKLEKSEKSKDETETEEEYSERMAEQKKVKQYEGEDPNQADALSGVVTYAAVNNDVLMIGTNIDQFLGSGDCNLSLIRDGKEIYSTNVGIVAEVSTSACDGFNIPTNNLGSGTTEIVIKLNSGEKTGIIRGEVSL